MTEAVSSLRPRRFLGYMAGRSTPLFLNVMKELVAQVGPQLESCHLVVGDEYNYRLAQAQELDSRIHLIYQHEHLDPFPGRSRLDRDSLAGYEPRYGLPHLQQHILAHRLIDDLDEEGRAAYLQTYLDYYDKLSEEIRPDVFITGGQDSLLFLTATAVFRRNGAIPLVMVPGRIPGRFMVVDNHLELVPGLRIAFDALKETSRLEPDEARAVDALRDGFVQRRMRLAAFGLGHQVRAIPSPLRLVKTALHRYRHNDKFFDHTIGDGIRKSFLIRARWPLQRILRPRLIEPVPTDGKFFFFPLHYEPEATIDVQGTIYRSQVEIIKRVSAALPAGHVLCVKEHPNMFVGLRPLGFYRSLVRLGNVRLVSGAIDGHELIARCRGVVTIAGTAGFEALFFGRPVLMFGRSFYEDFHEGVFRAGSFEDIARRLSWMADCADLDGRLVDRFMAAVLRRSYPGVNELPARGVNDPANHATLARALLAELDFRLNAAAA